MLNSYKELTVWNKGVSLVLEIYKITSLFPKEEIYGLVSQMRRAAIAIPSNIAEGYSRKHRKEYSQFVRIALGSATELETQLFISKKLSLGKASDIENAETLLTEVLKMLVMLDKSLLAKP